ncbi:hypothetical protein TeGR_g14309 [Tetraparma gracilis]|uniref:Uncharacterized protein n=1 Tax=Tetraparma gracilis TaxID=2962635 RepID=A0ABQ6MWM1_9STRA|nr:hypothetical protein TeGR_g14309 [Tetraparma gracilis]
MESDWKPECAEADGGLSAAAIWCDGQFIPLSNHSGQPDYVVRNDIYHKRDGGERKTAREDPTQPNLSDLMSPIAPTTKFMEDGETPRPDDCAFVNEIMSHFLWGKDANNPQIDALNYTWGPFSMPCDAPRGASDFVKDEMEELGICNPLLGPSDPWSDPGLLSCPQETMKDYCVERAETLCDKAFSGEGINKFGPEAPPIDPYGPLPTVIIVLIFFASIAYAAYVQKLASERKARSQKRQLEQSVSMSE